MFVLTGPEWNSYPQSERYRTVLR